MIAIPVTLCLFNVMTTLNTQTVGLITTNKIFKQLSGPFAHALSSLPLPKRWMDTRNGIDPVFG
jgi:hypothetical protein